MPITYYEAFGETRKKLQQAMQERKVCFKALSKWAKSFGGKLVFSDSTLSASFYVSCEMPKEAKHFKQHSVNKTVWEPKHSTKRGKEIRAEMERLAANFPSRATVMDMLGIGLFDSFPAMSSIGVYPRGKRLFVAIRAKKYKPPKGIDLKRISDTLFESLVPNAEEDDDSD